MTTVIMSEGVTGPDAPAVDTGEKSPNRPEGLPENFDSVEALVTSYKEAQAKLTAKGQQDSSETDASDTTTETKDDGSDEEKEAEAAQSLPENLTEFSEQFAKDGELNEDSYTKLADLGYSKDVVDAYIRGATGASSDALDQPAIDAIKASVGGEESFTKLQTWAGENLSDVELERYNVGIENKATAQMSVDWLKGKMDAKEGFEPATKVEAGNANTAGSSGYQSTAELSRDMQNPLYKSGDKAFHAQVDAKLKKTTAF